MRQAVSGWTNVTEAANRILFSGHPGGISTLTSLIADGHFIEGSDNGQARKLQNPPDSTDVQASVMRIFYGYCIPMIWSQSDTSAFVVDSGYSCSTQDPLVPQYLTVTDSAATEAC